MFIGLEPITLLGVAVARTRRCGWRQKSLFRRKSAGAWNLGQRRVAGLRERRIVLMAAQGMNKEIAAELEVDANKVGRWRARVAKEGTSSIEKGPRGANHGGKNTKKQAQLRSEVVEATTQSTPNDATHWSCRSMARHGKTTHSFVNRVWRAHGLKLHLIRTFKLSNDPRFEEKLRDVVGLYLDPPHNAAVSSDACSFASSSLHSATRSKGVV